jgi:hypothetical protein
VAVARSTGQHANEVLSQLFLTQSLAGRGQREEALSRLHEARALLPRLTGWDARTAREVLTETETLLRA